LLGALRSAELGHYVTGDAEQFLSLDSGRLGHPHLWISEAGVELQNGAKETPLAGEGETELKRQRLAANDLLQLTKVSRYIQREHPSEHVYQHIEWLYYYLYKSPTKAQREKHIFDSALLEVEPAKPEYEEREAYCILALNKPACPSRVITEAPVSGTTTSSASTVLLTLDSRGLPANYFVEYGTTTAYGYSTSPTAVANDNGTQSETVSLSSLEPCTTYHYQAEAESSVNEGKPSLGGDKTFTTACLLDNATAVSVGGEGVCALLSTSGIDCWGSNEDGQLGNGTVNEHANPIPTPVSDIIDATEVASGTIEACAVLSDGDVDCWGSNQVGQLGNGTTENSSTPVPVSGITSAIAVTVGGEYACALLSDGAIDCWGENYSGMLGDGTRENSLTPVPVSGITDAVAVSAGQDHTCALLSSGAIDCWGYGGYGELGSGKVELSTTPVRVSEITNATGVSVGIAYTCATLSSGDVDCWGGNFFGTLGNGTTENSSIPVRVSGITAAVGVTAGSSHACAVLSDGSVECWGASEEGALGNGTTNNSSTPVKMSSIDSATAVNAGNYATCVLLSDDGIDCTGYNGDGRLGDGLTENSLIPVPVITSG
jgi:alpha-tubulin suppressor-like RCC1 family protein